MARRLIGMLMLLIGLSGIGASVMGARIGYLVLEKVGDDLVGSLGLLSESLDRVEDTLLLARTTVKDVSDGLETVVTTTDNLGRVVDETRPLMSQIGQIASKDVPDSIESVNEAIPGISQVAGVVDDTLNTLSKFRIDEEILGFEFHYDLGINYNPAIPFDDSVDLIGAGLEGIPDQLRGLKFQIESTDDNMAGLSQDIYALSKDVDRINGRIQETDPLLDGYLSLIIEINDRTRMTRSNIKNQLADARQVITFLTVWLGLTQIAPIYLGWELVLGRRLR